MSLLGLRNASLHDMLTWRSMIVPSDTTILDGIYSHNKWIYVLFLLLLSLSLSLSYVQIYEPSALCRISSICVNEIAQ